MEASCQCGGLTASIADNAEPMVIACHCRECQRRSGSPFGEIAYFPRDSVALDGEVREYARPTDSGHTFTTGFCPACGSTVYARTSRFPDILGITVGTLADPNFPPPSASMYEQGRHPWIALPPDTPGFVRGRDGDRRR